MPRPNILFLMTDQQRFDALGCAGNAKIHTPNLDALAASGVQFTNAFTPTPICVAARMSLITGHRISRHRRPENAPLPGPVPELPTLMSLLAQAGYWTQAVGKMHFSGRHYGFHDHQSMEECPKHRIDDDYLQYLHQNGVKTRFPQGIRDLLYFQPQTSGIPLEHAPNTWVANRSIDFIRQHRKHRPEKPFFLWSSWISPHPPFAPCEPYDTMYDPNEMLPPAYTDRPLDNLPPSLWGHRARLDGAHRDPERIRRIRALYYGLISHVDDSIGRILSELEAQGIADNTIICFFSDHGDMLGDHGLSQKNCPYEPSIHIPMLMRWPNRTETGHVCNDLVSLLDILPTFTTELGLPHPEPNQLPGSTLLGQPGGGLSDPRDTLAIDYAHGQNRWVAVRTQTHTYTHFAHGGVEELYDLQTDSHQTQNIASADPGLTMQLRNHATAWERQHGFPEALNGNEFRTYPNPDHTPNEADCRTVSLNTGPWPKRLPKDERDTVESFADAFTRAIQKEPTLFPNKLSLDHYHTQLAQQPPDSHASDTLNGTPWETACTVSQ